MNERQAESQYKLSNKRPLGRNSVVNKSESEYFEEDEGGGFINSEGEAEKRVTITKFILSVVFGLVLDLISIIPIIGWAIGTGSLIVLYKRLGVKFHFKNLTKFGGCSLVEAIPAISAVPAFTLAVILNVGPMVWGQKQDPEEMSQPVHSVQKVISMTKK